MAAAQFPARNYLTDLVNYNYEGNWGFARFDGDDVLAARFGFGMGGFCWEDWGADTPSAGDYLFLQLEMMTSEAAVLWLCGDHFKAGDCHIGDAGHALTITDDGRSAISGAGQSRHGEWQASTATTPQPIRHGSINL